MRLHRTAKRTGESFAESSAKVAAKTRGRWEGPEALRSSSNFEDRHFFEPDVDYSSLAPRAARRHGRNRRLLRLTRLTNADR